MQTHFSDHTHDQNGTTSNHENIIDEPNPKQPELSFTLSLHHSKCLKKVLSAISSVGSHANNAGVMEMLETGVVVRVTHVYPAQDVLTLLKMDTSTSFQHFGCQRSYRCFGVDLRKLGGIVKSARDDEAISVSVEEESSSINALHFAFINQNEEECRNASMEATDQVNMEHWTTLDESIHEFKVCIRTADFAHILEHARLNKEAIQMTMTRTTVTIISGCEILVLTEEHYECVIKDAPANMRHELWLSVNHINTFLLACSLMTTSVWIHDSQGSRSHGPPLLEFPLAELGKLLVYLPQPFVV